MQLPRTLVSTFTALIALGGLVLGHIPANAADDTLAKIKTSGELIIGNGAAFPPFEYVDNGDLVGYDIDLGEELAKRLGVKATWVKSAFGGLIPGLTSKRTDMLLTAMAYTAERAASMAFSEPYFMTGVAAAYKPGVKLDKPDDLAGKNVGVQSGTSGEQFVRNGYGDKVASLKTYDEFLLALRDLEIGRLDVVVNTGPTIAFNVKQRGVKLNVTDNFDSRIIGMNTRTEEVAFMAEINKHIRDMKSDGFFAKIDQKWFGRDMEHDARK